VKRLSVRVIKSGERSRMHKVEPIDFDLMCKSAP